MERRREQKKKAWSPKANKKNEGVVSFSKKARKLKEIKQRGYYDDYEEDYKKYIDR